MAAATIQLTHWEPSDLHGKTVAFCLSGVLGIAMEAQRLGTFSVEGPKHAAVVLILPTVPESPETTVRIWLWQAAVERIARAEPDRRFEFTCFT